ETSSIANEHGDGEARGGHAEDVKRGPHGGRLLSAGDVQLELQLSEEEDPPAYKAYLYDGSGKSKRPSAEQLVVHLQRLGGRRDSLSFRIDGDHFHSTAPVPEPHSFSVEVVLTHGAEDHRWQFEQDEGRIELAEESIASAGILTGAAGPSLIEVTIEAPGEVRLNAERVVQVRPRFPGIVRQMRKRLGDPVRPGDVLATVHSNESLAEYPITAATSGTIVSQDAAIGQAVEHESILYTFADLTSVWVDFPIYPQSAGRIRKGQTVRVQSESGPPVSGQGVVRYVGPLLEQDTRVSYGRVVLDNRDRRWQPGMYVTAHVTVEHIEVPVAVPDEAIVRMSEGAAVFRAEGNRFEPQPVTIGRSDRRITEIVAGLEPGARIVTKNAFLLKAELGKSEAHHEH
ncbi:MAG TPA: efflux RND transporter periplasmic adaptor subunit, partial [Candidatus Limnocylindria bacterium]|nr:efflux RND transporter periplasmic adaptor subunit [Candidatus Limnocylindria bacterium]